MSRLAGYALLIIGLISLVVWAVSNYVQPILPFESNNSLFLLFAAITSTAGFISAFKDSIELLQFLEEARNKRLLNEKFSRGPYDEATIARSTRYYISPKCSNIDPAQEKEPRHALMATREPLFSKVDEFLNTDNGKRHLLILADSGIGKTSFVLNYYAYNYRKPKNKQHHLALVPLGIKDADERISSIPNPEETVLFLDALDEDVKAIADHRQRIKDLMNTCWKFKRVIITCRTQFFPKDEEIPVETGIVKISDRKAGERRTYEFWKLYLSPFDDEDIKKYLHLRYPIWAYRSRKKAHALASKIPLLSVRPMLLAHIPDMVTSESKIKHQYQLYEIMVNAWLERESSWVDKETLRKFSEQLAVDIYLHREHRGSEYVPYAELPALAEKWGIKLEQWQMSGRSLLNRDAEGNFKFAHRSIMEYLFALCLFDGDERCYGLVLTDQMKEFFFEMLSYDRWISYRPSYEEKAIAWLMHVNLSAYGYNTVTELLLSVEESKEAAFIKELQHFDAPPLIENVNALIIVDTQTGQAVLVDKNDMPISSMTIKFKGPRNEDASIVSLEIPPPYTSFVSLIIPPSYTSLDELRIPWDGQKHRIPVQMPEQIISRSSKELRTFCDTVGSDIAQAIGGVWSQGFIGIVPVPPDFDKCILKFFTRANYAKIYSQQFTKNALLTK